MGKGSKSLVYYVAMLLVFGIFMYLITKGGEALEIKDAITLSMDAPDNLAEGFEVFKNLLFYFFILNHLLAFCYCKL